MGPMQSMLKIPKDYPQVPPNPQANGLGYNPRCLRRDISTQSSNETRDEVVSNFIKNNKDITRFQRIFEGEFAEKRMGIHTGGHYTIGGDAGSDFYNSPADPAFFPHHAMVDRVWWTWQNLDLKNRQYALSNATGMMPGAGAKSTLDSILTMGEYVGAKNITIREASNTIAGPFCYIYA
jgi:tyrosinase